MAKSPIYKGKAQADRPAIPPSYGIQPIEDEKSLMPLQHINEKMRGARNYWVSTTRPDGSPHAVPVWGIWLDEAFFFSTDPNSRKGRNLAANPHIVVHLESGDDVIILEGVVHLVGDTSLLKRADQVYFEKYQFHLLENIESPGLVYQLIPQVAYAWFEKSFSSSATRWKF
jgi:general stress protein 26